MTLNTAPSTDVSAKNGPTDMVSYYLGNFVETVFDKPQNTSNFVEDTKIVYVVSETTEKNPSKADRLYPHLIDNEFPEGKALVFIKNALNDAQNALEAFGDPDLRSVMTHLTQIAATMGKTHPLTNFNESLGSVVSYIRRATLLVTVDEIKRSSLNSLITALQSLISNPLMGLNDACEIIESLSNDGWCGEHSDAEALISALFDDIDIVDSNTISSTFEDLIRQ